METPSGMGPQACAGFLITHDLRSAIIHGTNLELLTKIHELRDWISEMQTVIGDELLLAENHDKIKVLFSNTFKESEILFPQACEELGHRLDCNMPVPDDDIFHPVRWLENQLHDALLHKITLQTYPYSVDIENQQSGTEQSSSNPVLSSKPLVPHTTTTCPRDNISQNTPYLTCCQNESTNGYNTTETSPDYTSQFPNTDSTCTDSSATHCENMSLVTELSEIQNTNITYSKNSEHDKSPGNPYLCESNVNDTENLNYTTNNSNNINHD